MKYDFSEQAFEEYVSRPSRPILKRINALLRDIARNGNTGIGKPEALRGNLAGYWSRRIYDEHRLIYRVENNVCEIYQCRGHYDD
ncbi:MAG: Txe/YoeB family addiction module toxin [Desulfovibrio sp.]|jgi:toxin YoeB|nr:Txe/YoeB family addiction module toxin [Desulfovibrio sp.]